MIEVLSPSTRDADLNLKGAEYQAVPSIDTIAFIDVEAQSVAVCQRIATGWTKPKFSTALDIAIPSLGVTVPRDEIFAQD